MKKMKSVVTVLGVVAALGAGVAVAHSHSTGIPEADKRIALMKELGMNMKAVAGVAKGEAAYTPALNNNAKRIQEIAAMMGDLFPEGSGGPKTRSKDEIWTDKDGFAKAVAAFDTAAAGLVPAVASGDQGKIGMALGAVGKTCGGCHKPFRSPKDH